MTLPGSRKEQAHSQQVLIKLFWKNRYFMKRENLTSHVFFLAFSFAPSWFVLVHKSTSSISTFVINSTPFLLHSLKISSRQPHEAITLFSFFSSLCDRELEPFSSTSLLLTSTPSLRPPFHEGRDVGHENLQIWGRHTFVISLNASYNTVRKKELHYDQGGWPWCGVPPSHPQN